MNLIGYERRAEVYDLAAEHFGATNQLVVAIEELSECQKEICKAMRGMADEDHLAEEIADATIMLEQVRLMFSVNEKVCEEMDRKIMRLSKLIGYTPEVPE